jgi:hypothetical protein
MVSPSRFTGRRAASSPVNSYELLQWQREEALRPCNTGFVTYAPEP